MGMKDAFLKAGLVTAAQAAQVKAEPRREAAAGPAYATDRRGVPSVDLSRLDPASPDPAHYGEHTIRWAAAAAELLGKSRTVDELAYAWQEGTGAARMAFDDVVEGAITRRPRDQQQSWRDRLPRLGGAKGVPTFCSRAEDVINALRGGAVDAWLEQEAVEETAADKLVVPAPNAGEDLELYSARLETWASVQVPELLKRRGIEIYDLVRVERERREQETERTRETKVNALVAAFLGGGSFEALAEGVGGDWTAADLIKGTSRAWEMAAVGKMHVSSPSVAPRPEWLAQQTNHGLLVGAVQQAREEFRPAFRGRILELLQLRPGQAAIVNLGNEVVAVAADGRCFKQRQYAVALPEGTHAAEPNARGWVELTVEGFRYFGPTVFQHFAVLRSVKPGEVLIDKDVAAAFSKHTERGYSRLRWEISAGSDHSSFELPVAEGELARHVEALGVLVAEGLADLIPAEAWWLNATLGTTGAGKPRLNAGRAPKPAALVFRQGHEMGNGRHGWRGSSVDAGADRPGAKFLWKGSACSRGGRNAATAIVGWIEDGATLAFASGLGLRFDSGDLVEIPGGGLESGQ